MSRLLFLSHSGIDTEAAKALKARLLAAPAARDNGLSVWFDKDDLRAGESWQSQLEDAIGGSHAFAVYVGSKGVVNWVEAEVRLALNRAITEPDYRFVPILAGAAPSPEALPGFAQQFQGVLDVEARPDQFDLLMRAVLGGAEAGQLQLETEPFFGLRAIDENRSHLFFGRGKETQALVALVHRTPLVLVTGDSGSGKSSLVRAGLVPRFRGGALALLDGVRPEDAIWHVVTTRPRNQPFRQLGDAVDDAAKGLGLSLADRGTLADWAKSREIDKVRRGLRCDLPPERVQVLLVVDQFEELLTITPSDLRAPFIDLLLDLSDPAEGRHKVVLTMRHDYANLCNTYERLKARLDADDRRARFLLGRMSDEGLRRIVTEPLRLAAIEPADREALAGEVLRDVGERPGDLALVQMALTETWRARDQHDGDLLRAYADVGRVEGALAKAAERVRSDVLNAEQREFLDSILLRLVRLGDTGGATRRVASRGEFDDARWSLIQKLASEEGKRLLLLRGSDENPTVEIAHEALVTAWPYFQNLLQQAADDKRILDALIPRAQAWAAEENQHARENRLATGADLELFASLLDRRGTWLSGDERRCVEASAAAAEKKRQHERQMTRALQGIAAALLVAFAIAGWMWWRATGAEAIAVNERDKATAALKAAEASEAHATEAAKVARAAESRALTALSEVAFNQQRYVDAVKLALASWPRTPDGDRPKLKATIKALGQAQRFQREAIPPLRHEGEVRGAAFNGEETRIVTWSGETARLWDAATGKEVLPPLRHEQWVLGAAFNAEDTRILTWSGETARLWDTATSKEVVAPLRHQDDVLGAAFNGDSTRILTWSEDDSARLWDAATGKKLLSLPHEEVDFGGVNGAAFNADATRILTWSADGTARLWDAATGENVVAQRRHFADVLGAAFNRDESRILTWSHDYTARLWDAATGEEAVAPLRHEGDVVGAVFNLDESQILTWSVDDTARLWGAATGKEVVPSLHHEDDVQGAAFNADATRILTWSEDGTARLWDAATGEEVTAPLRHEGDVLGAAFNADATRILTWSADGTARLWDAATGKEVEAPLRHEGDVLAAAFNHDETRILTRSADGTARLWDAATAEVVAPVLLYVLDPAFNHDGTRILTRSPDGTARLWDAATGEVVAPLWHKPGAWVEDAAFNGDGTRILTRSEDGTARLWDAATGEEVMGPLRHQGEVRSAIFNHDGTRILTRSEDGAARLWDAAAGKEVEAPLGHGGDVLAASFNHDGTRILTRSEDGPARLWDAATGEEVIGPLRHQGEVRSAIFNQDKTLILTRSEDGAARLWDAATGEEVMAPLRHDGEVRGATFNHNETRILTWSDDRTVRLWDAATGKEVIAPLRHEGEVRDAAFNHDETGIFTRSGDGTARLWDAATGEEVMAPLRHQSEVWSAVFNHDGTRILTRSEDGTARLWDAATGEEVMAPLRHQSEVWSAVFNHDGTRILTRSEDGTARLWDAATGEEVLPPLWHKDAVAGAAFNHNETRILTWSSDGTARLWDISRLPRGHLIDVACGMLPDRDDPDTPEFEYPDTSELKERYGIAIVDPICGPDTPAPIWSELVD